MQDDQHFEEEEETKPSPPVAFEEEEIRISSSSSSPNIEDTKASRPSNETNHFQMFDQFITAKQEEPTIRNAVEVPPQQPQAPTIRNAVGVPPEQRQAPPKQPDEEAPEGQVHPQQSVIEQVQKQWIIKNAEMQRIGGTYDFFSVHLERYRRHLQARKIVLGNISALIDKGKITRAHPVILLKEYFKEYAAVCADFHERSYKYDFPQREETDNKMANMRVDLRPGFDRLFAVRKQTGNEVGRLEKFMRATTISKIDKAIEVFWGGMAAHQAKCNAKRDAFEEREKKFQKRVDKVSKVYSKGRLGSEIDEDVFEEMTKFVKEERELRFSIYDWGKEILNLRKNAMNADYGVFTEFEAILTEYKHFNDTVYQLQKKKFNFCERLKSNIEDNFLFERLCTPLDNDYIMSVLNFKNKSALTLLRQQDYEHFINEEYFGDIIGETTEFLKGTIIKSFPLKNPDEDLVKTVSGNLVHYNKRSLDVKYKAKIANTSATFEGYGCVSLKEVVKGIIFDSENVERVYFKDDNRAEELVLFLSGELEAQ